MNANLPSSRPLSPGLREMLASRVLVCDGAMGTMLQASGVPLDYALPELNISRPQLVAAIHGAYIAAGADIIETNTFAASRTRLTRHGFEDRVTEFNRAGVEIARSAITSAGRQVLLAGSVSPATPPASPGRLSAPAMRDSFREQIEVLADAGVDFILFETFGSLEELIEAVSAAQDVDSSLPLVAQMTFLDDGKTLAGETPAEVAAHTRGLGLAALGANCTLGPQGLLEIVRQLARDSSLPITAQPNAGSPSFVDGRFQYTADAGYFARYAARYAELGAVIIGGCCGTTPAHIEAAVNALRSQAPVRRIETGPAAGNSTKTEQRLDSTAGNLTARLRSSAFTAVAELVPPPGGSAEQAVSSAERLKEAGFDSILISPPTSPRAQASPASIAVLARQRIEGLEPILTVSTWEKSAMGLQANLLGAHAFGIRNVVCRTGVPPLVGDYPGTGGFWEVGSVELIQLLKALNSGRDRHGLPLAQPTSFTIGARINPQAGDMEREVEDARRKFTAGADFFMTSPAFDLPALDRLLDAINLPPGFPVLMGVLPIRDSQHAEYLNHEVPDMSLPPETLKRIHAAGEGAVREGRRIAVELIAIARHNPRLSGVVLTSSTNAGGELIELLQDAQKEQ